MKKLFIREDGTINLKVVIYSIIIVLFLILVLMYVISESTGKITSGEDETITTTTKQTTTMNLCKDCKLDFIREEYNLKTDESVDLKSLLDIKSINIKNIKFTDYDESLVTIKSDGTSIYLTALNKLGSTNIKASYQDKSSTIKISVFSDYIESAKLNENNYYVYLDDQTNLTLTTNPLNVNVNFFNVLVDDETKAVIQDGVITGKGLGKTKLSLNYNGVTSTSNLYVIKNRIAIYINEKEYSKYTTNNKTFNILVKSLDKDITSDDLTYTIDNNGKLSFIEPVINETNTFKYSVDLEENGEYNLEFTLNDGSKTGMSIIKN